MDPFQAMPVRLTAFVGIIKNLSEAYTLHHLEENAISDLITVNKHALSDEINT